jgi:hypothetical protein
MWPAEEYRRAGSRLDRHIDSCSLCSEGTGCPAGDSAAEKEFRAWREWERADEAGTQAHRRAGFPW